MSTQDTVSIIAGSIAGISEHFWVYPIDTVKTHVQTTRASAPSFFGTFTTILKDHGAARLWRGVHLQIIFCGPAHALMFLSYEKVKEISSRGMKNWKQPSIGQRTMITGFLAGCISSFFHDLIMVPADTVKARLQLGHYRNTTHAVAKIMCNGGRSFFRAFGTTLAMNIPYGAAMMTINEYAKFILEADKSQNFPLLTFLTSGGTAGAVAGALTTPLDVCRTRLQTQSLLPKGSGHGNEFKVLFKGLAEVAGDIFRKEGWKGFTRGLSSRTIMGAPACAISWTTYEACKKAIKHRHIR